MLDEVQSGIGRTGKWFAYQHAGIAPDVMTLAKGLGDRACRSAPAWPRGAAAGVFKPGNHGSTFGGNPLACAAALATLDAIEDEGLMANADADRRAHPRRLARRARGRRRACVEIRGKGLMIGIELDRPCGELVDARARSAAC